MRSRMVLSLAAATFLFIASFAAADDKPDSATRGNSSERARLEETFARTFTGATLAGRFNIDGKSDDAKPHTDRYEVERAEKVEGHRWMITARIKYGKHDVKIPVPVDVYWAGDTPVISLTNVTIPGLGTFTTRVMVHGDRYAGSWQHDAVGGHMWGKIEHAKPAATSNP